MATPATTGQLVTTLTGMNIGDYIACQYLASTSGSVGTFSGLGGAIGTEIPLAGTATPNGGFYFLKVDKGLLIADRNVQTSISWDALNTGKVIQGLSWNSGSIRSLSGGVAYADMNSNYSTTDLSNGSYPANNEWAKYVVSATFNGKITAGDDNVWHWSNNFSWTRDTTAVAIATNTNRVYRGKTGLKYFGYALSSSTVAGCFRPAYQYIE